MSTLLSKDWTSHSQGPPTAGSHHAAWNIGTYTAHIMAGPNIADSQHNYLNIFMDRAWHRTGSLVILCILIFVQFDPACAAPCTRTLRNVWHLNELFRHFKFCDGDRIWQYCGRGWMHVSYIVLQYIESDQRIVSTIVCKMDRILEIYSFSINTYFK